MDAFISIIKDVGFPIFVAVFLLFQQRDLKTVIKENTKAMTKFCEKTGIQQEGK